VLETLRLDWSVQPAGEPFLHPGRAGEVRVDGARVGWLGELHPLVARAWDLDGGAAFEVDLDALLDRAAAAVPAYEDLTSFPAVRQDLAVVVEEEVAAGAVIHAVRGAGGDLLSRAEVFDVYRGDQIGPGRVSLALALEFRAPDRTLTDEEVARLRDRIAGALRDELGGELRA
jgi:phenylalanyl-tRNA synthetase beta chain